MHSGPTSPWPGLAARAWRHRRWHHGRAPACGPAAQLLQPQKQGQDQGLAARRRRSGPVKPRAGARAAAQPRRGCRRQARRRPATRRWLGLRPPRLAQYPDQMRVKQPRLAAAGIALEAGRLAAGAAGAAAKRRLVLAPTHRRAGAGQQGRQEPEARAVEPTPHATLSMRRAARTQPMACARCGPRGSRPQARVQRQELRHRAMFWVLRPRWRPRLSAHAESRGALLGVLRRARRPARRTASPPARPAGAGAQGAGPAAPPAAHLPPGTPPCQLGFAALQLAPLLVALAHAHAHRGPAGYISH